MDAERREIVKYTGINIDIPPGELIEVPVWTNGSNVHFDDGSTHRVEGYARFADPMPADCYPIFIHPVLTPEVAYWIIVSEDNVTTPGTPIYKIYVTDGSTYNDITPVAGITGTAGEWTACDLNGVPVLNSASGTQVPIWWDGSTGSPMAPLPDWPADTYCKSIRAYKYHLVALNITQSSVQYPFRLMWSASTDPGTIPSSWTPLPENDAGDNDLADNLGGIIDGGPLRDVFVIYFQHSTVIMQYIAGQYVFAFRSIFETSGIQARNCWTEIKGHHIVITEDDVIKHDGQKFASIADARMRAYLFSGITPENYQLCHLCGRTDIDEIMIVIPTTNSTYCELALLYNYNDDVWGARTLPSVAHVKNGIVPKEPFDTTWDGALEIWQEDPRWWNQANYSATSDSILMAQTNQQHLQEIGASHDADDAPLESSVERLTWAPHGEAEIWDNNLIRSIYPRITGREGDTMTVRIGTQQIMSEPIRWGPEMTLTIGREIKMDNLLHGRYLSMRFSTSGGEPWNIHRIGIEYIPLAKY